MKLRKPPGRVQIRVNEGVLIDGRFKTTKGRVKSMSVYETNLEEVWAIIEQAIKSKCEEEAKR